MSLPDFDQLWNYTDPASSEASFRKLLPKAKKDPAYKAELQTQIARALGLQRRFDEAHAVLNEVEKALTDKLVRPRVRYLLERGRVFNSSNQPEQARPLFLAAYELARTAGEEGYAVDAAHMLAIADSGQAALAWNLKGIALAEASQDARARRWLGPLYNNLGWMYHDLGEYQRALDIFVKAQQLFEQEGKAEPIRIAKWTVGRVLRSLGRFEEALTMQQDVLGIHGAEEDGYVSEEVGECLLALGRAEEAKVHFARAYALLSQDAWFVEAEPQRLERLRGLG